MKTTYRLLAQLLLLIALVDAKAACAAEPRTAAAASVDPIKGKLPRIPPTPAKEAWKTFRVLDGFRMNLIAAEPLVASPVAMTYDENGRAYVCEMRDYPYTDKAHHKAGQENPTDQPIGRVRLLEDTDGDGVFDKATVFAEELSWPTGVSCWKGGVFVAATPDVWYLKDNDGDGKADERRKVFTGFRKLNVQAVMNTLVWGLDNHIHGAGGSNGGKIRPGDKTDAKPLTMARNDFRIDPVTGEMELLSGGARYGGTFDDWGNRFLCNIRNPAQHIILPSHYLARNRYLAAPSPLADMAESGDQLPVYPISQPEAWRALRAKRWAGTREIMPRSELVGSGVVTSASGITSYRGVAYPEKYRGNVFVTECAGNLLYRLQLTPDGVTFKAARVDGKAEMVASTDNWFRPVNFVNAPDGTLHVLDMYRENIEHPWSIPEDIHAAVDLEAGREMGRLWRLTPPNFKLGEKPRLGKATSAELVTTLENPNSWWRETAQRLLFERQDKSVVPALHTMVKNGRTPHARLHALWSLIGMNELNDDDLLLGLQHQVAGVRENAIKLAEPRVRKTATLVEAILPLVNDSDARVRFQTAFTLGELSDPRALDALATLARRDANDLWIRTAVLSSVSETGDQLLVRLLADAKFLESAACTEIIQDLSQIIAVRNKTSEMQRVLEAVRDDSEQNKRALRSVVMGMGRGLKRSSKNLRGVGLSGKAKHIVENVLDEAVQVAANKEQSSEARIAAIRVLPFDDFDHVKATLADLLSGGRQPQEIQRTAVTALGSFNSPEVVPLLLANWQTQTPAVRSEIVNAMLGARSRALPLLKSIESGLIPANQILLDQRRLLGRSNIAEVRKLAAKLFSDSAPGPRKEVIEKYRSALSFQGDVGRGREVFEKSCISCHRSGDVGTKDVGPNLANIRAWNSEQLLINILDPNREVAPNFVTYTVSTNDGRILNGLITDDGVASIVIKRADGTTETVLRRDIEEIAGSGLSIMPEGLESTVSPQGMADLIAFLLRPESEKKR